ncbi:hypothetical protein G3545_08320 [Starkeya sp. ORNL1]|uniref:hypothetical protein n=1 Tax=Starkeya sp. ORNL1 TaxID=2709380 RepID=UPI0014633C89|nr:hypothetical protein [Starkeya sp. ORNL1]QJP13660.1 hypothetical protein G3545_08320 [Starkeya sp. ORNL1]
MSLHRITLCVKRFMQIIDEEVADAAEMNARAYGAGDHRKAPAAARHGHATLFGA